MTNHYLLQLQAFNTAMCRQLYDCVAVHGSQEDRKAYACTNCMEFFAELSVAFLWRQDTLTKELRGLMKTIVELKQKCKNIDNAVIDHCDIEFNKWFPHNYSQLHDHDKETCSMLSSMWNLPLLQPAFSEIPHMGSEQTTDDLYYTIN